MRTRRFMRRNKPWKKSSCVCGHARSVRGHSPDHSLCLSLARGKQTRMLSVISTIAFLPCPLFPHHQQKTPCLSCTLSSPLLHFLRRRPVLCLSSVMTTVPPSNAQGVRANKLVALPSLSCALSSLPQATSLDSVSLHPNMYAQRAAESEAKLKKVLSKTAASQPQTPPPPAIPAYMNPSQYNQNSPNSSPPLMMRKSQKPKFQA